MQINTHDGGSDPDADGYNNAAELAAGTNPNSQEFCPGTDCDGNGLTDAWEVLHFSSIGQSPAGNPDGDASTNQEEHDGGTDPNDPEDCPVSDCDNDGLQDSCEFEHWGNLSPDPSVDDDVDSLSNLVECNIGTDPRSASSGPGEVLVPVMSILLSQ